MKKLAILLFLAAASAFGVIVPTAQTVTWSASGVSGGIPTTRTDYGAGTISTALGNDSTDARSAINTAITNCPVDQVVNIPPGTYRVNGSINHKSNITIRGKKSPTTGMWWALSASSNSVGTGAKTFTTEASLGYVAGVVVRVWRRADPGVYMQGTVTSYSGTSLVLNITESAGSGTFTDWKCSLTVLKSIGTGQGFIAIGSVGVSYDPTSVTTTISSGATSGSTSFVVASATGIAVNTKLVITELNNASFVSNQVSQNPPATWIDNWNTGGTRSRGQIVNVTGVAGTTITFTPALYTAYSATPWASRVTATTRAGVEDLMIFATNSLNMRNVWIQGGVECWLWNVGCDFADGDHVTIDFGYRCEIRQCWFRECFQHVSGNWDSQIGLRCKTTGTLVIDNILERLHSSILLEWGAAGNVIAYNYLLDEYDQGITSGNHWMPNSMLADHGGHPQFNLFEGNITQKFVWDSYWGTAGPDTALRNWSLGHGTTHPPYSARGVAGASETLNQDNATVQVWSSQFGISMVGNILGDSTMTTATFKIVRPTSRNYGGKYIHNLNYLTTGDDGTAVPVWGSAFSPVASYIDHGNYDYVNQAQTWDAGIADHAIPDSFFLSGKPTWFGDRPYPSFDPANPSVASVQTIPAGYRYVNGANPPASGDVTAPTPNPATIASALPDSSTQITVTATTATEVVSPPPAYAHSLVLDGTATVWQAWQDSPIMVFTGLIPSTAYDARVKSRDAALNETTQSAITDVNTNASAAITVGATRRTGATGAVLNSGP